jgi:glutathione reductase (NADPH)
MAEQFDVAVIGTGTAGTTVAYDMNAEGKSVAIIDCREYGGTCALRGCVPKKVFTAIGEAADWAVRLDGKGIEKGSLKINWSDMQKFKSTFTEPFPANRRKGYEDAGIVTFDGTAKFLDEKTLQVGDSKLEADHIIIATGSKPRPLSIPGGDHIITSEEFLNLDEIPERIIFTGGGYISMEFAHVAALTGADVRVIHRSAQPLKPFDSDLVELLVQGAREKGIQFNLNTEVVGVEKTGGELQVRTEAGGREESFAADLVVHGAGRVPQIDDLELEAGIVDYNARGIGVNEYYQSPSNPRVYAAGDAAASGAPLTPVATVEGHAVSANILEGNHESVDYSYVASTAFTLPPIASVGMSQQAAGQSGAKIKVNYSETGGWVTSRRVNEKFTGFKVILEEDSDKILGAHLLGPHAGEVINLFGLAIKQGLTGDDLKDMIYSYPTSSSDIHYMV